MESCGPDGGRRQRNYSQSINQSEPKKMSSWLQRQTSSHQAQIAATAMLSGLAVAGAIFGVQAIRRQIAVDDLKASIPNVDEEHDAETVCFVGPLLCTDAAFFVLTSPVKVPDFGASAIESLSSKEEERAAALALRAQHDDYDEGMENASNGATCLH